MSKRSPGLLVEDIWESIEKIQRYTEGMTQNSSQNDEERGEKKSEENMCKRYILMLGKQLSKHKKKQFGLQQIYVQKVLQKV